MKTSTMVTQSSREERVLCKWFLFNRLTYVKILCMNFSVPSKFRIVWLDSHNFFIKHYCSSATFLIFRSAQKKTKAEIHGAFLSNQVFCVFYNMHFLKTSDVFFCTIPHDICHRKLKSWICSHLVEIRVTSSLTLLTCSSHVIHQFEIQNPKIFGTFIAFWILSLSLLQFYPYCSIYHIAALYHSVW